jgi:hypothetical protein
MAEGTRVSQLADSLAKLKDDHMEFKTSTTAFQNSTSASLKRADEFQTSTQATLQEILKRLQARDSQSVQPNKDKELVLGEKSGRKDPIYVESTAVPEVGGVYSWSSQNSIELIQSTGFLKLKGSHI